MDDRGVAEADVHRGFAADSLQRAVQRLQPVLPRFFRARLHVRLVDLHVVGAGREQIADLLVDRGGVIHRRVFLALVEIVLRLLQHRERTGDGDLRLAIRVAAQELDVVDFDGMAACDPADDPRHGVGMARSIERRSRVVEIDAVERRGKPVRVALAPDLAVGDDVEAGVFLGADGDERGVVLRVGEVRLRQPPQFLRAHARQKPPGELRAVDQPFRLRVAPNQRRRQQHQASSRQTPSAFCAARSEKLKSTESSCASCATGCHDGTTKTSRGPHANDSSPTCERPRPSTAQ